MPADKEAWTIGFECGKKLEKKMPYQQNTELAASWLDGWGEGALCFLLLPHYKTLEAKEKNLGKPLSDEAQRWKEVLISCYFS